MTDDKKLKFVLDHLKNAKQAYGSYKSIEQDYGSVNPKHAVGVCRDYVNLCEWVIDEWLEKKNATPHGSAKTAPKQEDAS